MARRFLSACWRNLVMLNFEIDPEILRPLVPKGVELDPWRGKHFVSLVGFQFLHARVLGIPIPFHRNFAEVNLRFYVRRRLEDGWRRGVAFVKEVVPRWAIAAVARWLYNENYVACAMTSAVQTPMTDNAHEGSASYRWKKSGSWHALHARFQGPPCLAQPGSEEEYITEHYYGYVAQRDGSTVEYRVEHPRWRVWKATEAGLECAVASFYGEQYQETLSRPVTSAFVAEGSEVAVYQGELLSRV
jgi:uncharacterized protein YqjF (DUF2071 family)